MITAIIHWMQDRRCDHSFTRLRTIHGDERNTGQLSEWRCSKCGISRYSNRDSMLMGRGGKWWSA